MIWRPGPAGTLVAVRRGKPPPVPVGYEIANGNPYAVQPILVECPYRTIKLRDGNCCGGRQNYIFCTVVNQAVVRPTCVECKANPDYIKKLR